MLTIHSTDGSIFNCVISETLNVEKCRDLEIRVRDHSRSLKVVLFDRLYGFLFPISVL